jgi:hypothetical protein
MSDDKVVYIAKVGMNTPTGRFEVGDEVSGIPPTSVKGLLAEKAIEVKGAKGSKKAKADGGTD